jgi:phage tail-like protein
MSGLPNRPPPPSSLLQHLPAIYAETAFLGQFLVAFEELLFGRDDGGKVGGAPPAALERLIADLASHFDPMAAPGDFLPWLASWTAFTLRFDLSQQQQRQFIAKVIPLYRRRGTKGNLIELLRIFTISEPEITEMATAERPHFFRVTVYLAPDLPTALLRVAMLPVAVLRAIGLPERVLRPATVLRQIAIAKAIIELEKPAHTEFELDPVFPSMRIGVQSTVGVDTLLGTAESGARS